MACTNINITWNTPCISVNTECLTSRIKVSVEPILTEVKTKIQVIPISINTIISSLGELVKTYLTNLTPERHKIKCSIICTLAEASYYLNVTPEEIQWITEDMGVFYNVDSNVEWIITIN